MVSLLTVVGIMGVAFLFSMFLETRASHQFVATAQARYLAEAGISAAWASLDEDKAGSPVDDLTEPWAQQPSGHDADADRDGTAEARWWMVESHDGAAVGRFGFTIRDEAGKANLNMAQAEPAGDADAITLTVLLQDAGIGRAAEVAQQIQAYRYGGLQAAPGVDGVDDDRDGTIDEPDEYDPLAPKGNDRRLETLEEVVAIARLTAEERARLGRVATVYSWDANVSTTGAVRLNVNSVTAGELVPVLVAAAVEDPWQMAVNLADYVDADLDISRTTRSSQRQLISNQGPLGSWLWDVAAGEGYYASEQPDGAPLSWSAAVPSGDFTLRAIGIEGQPVGDLIVAGQLTPSATHLQSLGRFALNGTVQVTVINRRPQGERCAFRGLELVPVDPTAGGILVRGIEVVRINEVMAEPTTTLEVTSADFNAQGSDWSCQPGEAACTNSGVGQATWTWTNPLIPAGRYYVRVFGAAAGQVVGNVRIDGQTAHLVHGQRHPATVVVGEDGRLTVPIGKTDPEQTYYIKSVELSVQPDAEYLELINLGEVPIDVSGWTVTGDLTGGRDAQFPGGSVIAAHGLLVGMVDVDDHQAGLDGNGISARQAWELPPSVTAVQLLFPNGGPSPDDDWLKTTLPQESVARLVLRTDKGSIVDEVQYTSTGSFRSLEKGDPTVVEDSNADGIDDGWYASDISFEHPGYTPGQTNSNDGMREARDLPEPPVVHDPAVEITIRNRPIASIGELVGTPSGQAWQPLAAEELAKVVDRLTTEGHRLEASGAWKAGAAWQERVDGYEYANNAPSRNPWAPDQIGTWQWTNLVAGTYRLSLYGRAGLSGEQFSIRCGALQWKREDGSMTDWSPALTTDVQGRIVIGQVTVEPQSEPPSSLTLEAACVSPSGVCHFAYAQLDPRLVRVGPVNINTAPLGVLRALPGMTEALAARIIAGRPYGNQERRGQGIGDLLLGDVLGSDEEERLATFRRLANWVTTRSDVFQIRSLGQSMNGRHVQAKQWIEAVIER